MIKVFQLFFLVMALAHANGNFAIAESAPLVPAPTPGFDH